MNSASITTLHPSACFHTHVTRCFVAAINGIKNSKRPVKQAVAA